MSDTEGPCPHMLGCEMYELFSNQTLLEAWKDRYCHGGFTRCVRYEKTLCGERVSATLLPNGMNLPDVRKK